MSKMLKIVIVVISLIGLIGYVGYQYTLKKVMEPHYIDEPNLKGELLKGSLKTTNGIDRVYEYYVPQNLTDSIDIVYILHGSTSSGPDIRKQFGYEWDLLAEKYGFIAVYPTGYDNHWNDCRGRADYQANVQNIDDTSFLKSADNHIVTGINSTIRRRFATGFSNGGHFCFKLALESPEWIDGIAAISANLPVADGRDCAEATEFVPTMIVNGTEDWINPYDGGLVSIRGNDSRGTVHSTMETMKYFMELGNCDPDPSSVIYDDVNIEDESTIKSYTWHCDGGSVAGRLYQVNNGGHTLPHFENQLAPVLGNTNRDVIIAREIWNFFNRL